MIEEAVESARLKFAEILLHKNLFDVTFGEIRVSDCREAMRAALLTALRKIEPDRVVQDVYEALYTKKEAA